MNERIAVQGEEVVLPSEVPLFPLPDHVLLPGTVAPYRIFEPRYQAMVRDMLDGEDDSYYLVIPRLQPGWQDDYQGTPPIADVATLGRVVSWKPLPAGHFFLLVEGIARCRVEEIPSSRAYRLARVHVLPDLDEPGSEAATCLHVDLTLAASSLCHFVGAPADELAHAVSESDDLAYLVFRLGGALIDDVDGRQALLEERRMTHRCAMVVDALAALAVDRTPEDLVGRA